MEENREVKPVRRRRHSAAFKLEAVAVCMQPGVSNAAIALHYRLNANLLRRWVADHETQAPDAVTPGEQEYADLAGRGCAPAVESGRYGSQHAGHCHRHSAWHCYGHGALASVGCGKVYNLAARVAAVIRIDAVWLAVAPLDMRAGLDAALARVITVFGAAQPHLAYLFANRRENRMKVMVHDGIGIRLASRRLHQGRFAWPSATGTAVALSRAQLDALVVGLPWHRLGQAGVITVI